MRLFKLSKTNTRAMLYILIASFTALMSDLAGFKTLGEISTVGSIIILLNFILQGLIAWRAFLDQSISNSKKEDKENNEKLYRIPRTVELNIDEDK